MGLGGGFWEFVKPIARYENLDFLRDKKVAVDLSYWIVQHQTALKGNARNPHLRVTFFRTINLFSKVGAYPVFVLDGNPSPLKAQARAERFFRMSGIDISGFSHSENETIARNPVFNRSVQECVELLELLGMPILKAECEAEALCAQLDSEGRVDACITADSDAFLYGAKCVIKSLQYNFKERCVECYQAADIESRLGLKRKQMIVIALLVGNDYDMRGVPGIGFTTAARFVQLFHDDEILDRLRDLGTGNASCLLDNTKLFEDLGESNSAVSPTKKRVSHCSNCGHPGTKGIHMRLACDYCIHNGLEGCQPKPQNFTCECSHCIEERKSKDQKKCMSWREKICTKIATVGNFPNEEIIEMFLCQNHGIFNGIDGSTLSWKAPETELLVDFLEYHQHWSPSLIRQGMLPLLSTIFLREMASRHTEGLLLCDKYEFHSIQREKARYGHPFYVVKWKRAGSFPINLEDFGPKNARIVHEQDENIDGGDLIDLLDDNPDDHQIITFNGCEFLSTDEDVGLVQAAFPEIVEIFLKGKETKKEKSMKNKTGKETGDTQRSITEFFRVTKPLISPKSGEDPMKGDIEENSRAITTKNSKKYKRNSGEGVSEENSGGTTPKNSKKYKRNSGAISETRSSEDRTFSKSVRRRLLLG
ncbi:flap endonuclease GEN-like 1 [Amborella trichopoda]|uniref:XPG-I domain-containing protein n=1 Tax=Amborella trichopoda TaxID=13333 RepID=U5DA49_AMBTC|nr:flap endonuclease GEN-like 1 [Amborella trichopoda]ERN19384.1 hypothetical protein AMTR_s00069p00141590 [Amborella trichopoda]|eukprot:XP_006857917.1 flap endonuclease GEN-like 1 [Amborella trichopoda]